MRDLVILFVHVIATLTASWVRAASVPWSPSPFSSNSNYSSSIVLGGAHRICALQIALLPVCVPSSFALPA
jgi:hypothetical protein